MGTGQNPLPGSWSDPFERGEIMTTRVPGVVFAAALLVMGCGGGKSAGGPVTGEPDYVTVQHILISFDGAEASKATRTKEEAEALAMELFERAKSGEDFDSLVEEYTDDRFPGVYGLANSGAKPDQARQIYARDDMVDAFGDVAFSLAVGEVGFASYDPDHCKYGWHIILRIK